MCDFSQNRKTANICAEKLKYFFGVFVKASARKKGIYEN